MNQKIRLGLLFGGRSGEHEVSLLSANSIYKALDKNRYDITLIGITKVGEWMLCNSSDYLLNQDDPSIIQINLETSTPITPEYLKDIDVVFPVMHGTYGEDGAVQGLLEMNDVGYVGAGILGSAVGMDKDVMKRLLRDADINIGEYMAFKKDSITDTKLDEIIQTLHLPLFVKPANLGSSVGISKAHTKQELKQAVDMAFLYDTKVLVEEYIKGREIECAVLGNDDPKASIAGEIIPIHEFYSYQAKYLDENGAKLSIPAVITNKELQSVQSIAVKAFKVLECQGIARVDFFLTDDSKVYVNEINTIPGFTKISMYPKLWQASGIPYSDLLDRVIDLAIDKKKEKDSLKRSFN